MPARGRGEDLPPAGDAIPTSVRPGDTTTPEAAATPARACPDGACRRRRRLSHLPAVAAALLSALAPAGAAAAAEGRDYAYVFFQGTLTDPDGSRPIPGATVRLRAGSRTYEAVTDDKGAFVFDRLPVQAYDVTVTAPDGGVIQDVRELGLGDPARKRLKVRMGRGAPVGLRLEPGPQGLRIDVPPPRTRWSRLWKELVIFLGGAAILAA